MKSPTNCQQSVEAPVASCDPLPVRLVPPTVNPMRAARPACEHNRMGWTTTCDAAGFLEAAGSFLRAERARNTVLLTVAESARADPSRYSGGSADPDKRPLFGWWTAGDGAVGGAFLHTPPFPVLLSQVSCAAAAALATTTLAGRPLTGVNAYDEVAKAFATAWADGTGGQVTPHRRMRLYRLAGLVWPDPPPAGAPRSAADADVALLTEWITAFADEVHEAEGADQGAAVRERLSYGGLTLWETDDGPVGLAGLTRQVAG